MIGKQFICNGPNEFDFLDYSWSYEINAATSLIKIKQVGICSSDFDRLYEGKAHKYPLIIGHEIVGEIVETHPNSNFLSGDLVTVFPLLPCKECASCRKFAYNLCETYSYYGSRQSGGLSTFLEVENWNLKVISKKIELDLLNVIEPMSVVIHGFKKLFKSRENLILTGSGFLTFLAYLYGKSLGIENIYVESANKEFLSYLGKCGEFTRNEHLDYLNCLDFSGNVTIFEKVVKALSPKGQIVTIANCRIDTVISSEARKSILRKELAIVGSWNSTFTGSDSDWEEAISFLSSLQEFIFPIKPIFFDDFKKFIEENDRKSTIGKRIYVYF